MTTTTHDMSPAGGLPSRRHVRVGDFVFQGVAFLAAALATVTLGLLTYKVVAQAWPAIEHFGISFLWTNAWNPNTNVSQNGLPTLRTRSSRPPPCWKHPS